MTVGFGLTPLGWARLIGSDASAMANRVRELENELGTDPADLQADLCKVSGDIDASAAIFDQILCNLLDSRPPAPLTLWKTDRALRNHHGSVDSFAADVGVSSRTLHRLCLSGFGFPPKRLMRRQRFLETLGVIRENPNALVGAVLGPGYFDHSHFNRDFRDFMGMTARVYARTPRAIMQAAAAAQLANGIPLSFELPEAPKG